MRILVNTSGEVATQHDKSEFNLLEQSVILGNISTSAAHRKPDFAGLEGEIGPMVHPAEAAVMVTTATDIRNARGVEMSRFANTTLESANKDRAPEGTTVIQWQDEDSVQAVRSRLLIGLMEGGFRPGQTRTDSPDWALYDGLIAVENVLRMSPADAIEAAARYNEIGIK